MDQISHRRSNPDFGFEGTSLSTLVIQPRRWRYFEVHSFKLWVAAMDREIRRSEMWWQGRVSAPQDRQSRRLTIPAAKMHRSASTTRASDESFLANSSSGADLLPIYSPLSDVAKKEASRRRFAESAVHLIPLVLIVCGLVLWLFSYPGDGISSWSRIYRRSRL